MERYFLVVVLFTDSTGKGYTNILTKTQGAFLNLSKFVADTKTERCFREVTIMSIFEFKCKSDFEDFQK